MYLRKRISTKWRIYLQTLTLACIILLMVPKSATEQLGPSGVCRESLNSTEFEWQLNHLARTADATALMNSSIDIAIDDSRCNARMTASPLYLNERSLCPWDIVQDINNNRYPQILNFARCRCSRCADGQFECKTLSYKYPVLEKKCINGEYEYIKTYVDVPVGCTCSRPRVDKFKKSLWNTFMSKLKASFRKRYHVLQEAKHWGQHQI